MTIDSSISIGPEIHIESVKKGTSLWVYKVQEGEYCFTKFNVYDLEVRYKDGGLCFFVEAGSLNYSGDLIVGSPYSTQINNFPGYISMLNKKYPMLCKEYIGDACVKK